jgi:hypothetical protein
VGHKVALDASREKNCEHCALNSDNSDARRRDLEMQSAVVGNAIVQSLVRSSDLRPQASGVNLPPKSQAGIEEDHRSPSRADLFSNSSYLHLDAYSHGIYGNRNRCRAAAAASGQKAKEAQASTETSCSGPGREEGGATNWERVQYVKYFPASWDHPLTCHMEQISGTTNGLEVIEKTATQSTCEWSDDPIHSLTDRLQPPSLSKTKSQTRCYIKKDAGLTRADITGMKYYCLFFSRGCCPYGYECEYLHTLPTNATLLPDNSKGLFRAREVLGLP